MYYDTSDYNYARLGHRSAGSFVLFMACMFVLIALFVHSQQRPDAEIVSDLETTLKWTEVRVTGTQWSFTCGQHDATRRAVVGKLPDGTPVRAAYCGSKATGFGPRNILLQE
jgi:hypothetical protein